MLIVDRAFSSISKTIDFETKSKIKINLAFISIHTWIVHCKANLFETLKLKLKKGEILIVL
ncbi:hypothetical protein DERP_006813 [Dermatophagoides pteronyssinus]|uniref:Uncharacterized protein n=1 Tax=Dermatophagoides pteronyssinus TaxID=6956 RepID=A0ABQ8ISF7_DERPT|nr:hypothetical protein DERP_006813 [Dermatophagoides pteronyssinus]